MHSMCSGGYGTAVLYQQEGVLQLKASCFCNLSSLGGTAVSIGNDCVLWHIHLTADELWHHETLGYVLHLPLEVAFQQNLLSHTEQGLFSEKKILSLQGGDDLARCELHSGWRAVTESFHHLPGVITTPVTVLISKWLKLMSHLLFFFSIAW